MRWMFGLFMIAWLHHLPAQTHQFGIQLQFQHRLLATQLKSDPIDPSLTARGLPGFGLGINYLKRLNTRFALNAEANLLFDADEYVSQRFPAVAPDVSIAELVLPLDLYFVLVRRKDWRPFVGLGLSYGYQLTTGTTYEVFYPKHQFGGRISLGLEKVFRQFTCAPRLVYQQVLNEQIRADNWFTTVNYRYLHVQRLQFTLAFYAPPRRRHALLDF